MCVEYKSSTFYLVNCLQLRRFLFYIQKTSADLPINISLIPIGLFYSIYCRYSHLTTYPCVCIALHTSISIFQSNIKRCNYLIINLKMCNHLSTLYTNSICYNIELFNNFVTYKITVYVLLEMKMKSTHNSTFKLHRLYDKLRFVGDVVAVGAIAVIILNNQCHSCSRVRIGPSHNFASVSIHSCISKQ